MKVIARIYNDFTSKFGIPRQSGIGRELLSEIVFEKEFRAEAAIRGIEDFSHLWIIWEFSESVSSGWKPTVRPPRLGGNKRMGVFATRSPFRPNPIGLSAVKLERVEYSPDKGHCLVVSGADIMNGTPIYDIKPYISYSDSYPEAVCGFSDEVREYSLDVEIDEAMLNRFPEDKRNTLLTLLSNDPRPAYHADTSRVYGFEFAGYEIKFTVSESTLKVSDIICKNT